MKHLKVIHRGDLARTIDKGGCGECQASCQSACKTSCTVANQQCQKKDKPNKILKDSRLF